MLAKVKPTAEEVATALPGDDIVPNADVVMDRAFTLPATPAVIWPWFNQLGKNRSGWYFPRSVERFIPKPKRALWDIDQSLQNLEIGKIIDDWGGKNATFEVAILEPPQTLVHISTRGKTNISWAISLRSVSRNTTRVQLRLRLAPVDRKWLAKTIGNTLDALTVAGLAAGLRERLSAN